MKLLRYGPVGQEKPGLLDATGTIRDLSTVVPDISGSSLSPAGLDKLKSLDPQPKTAAIVVEDVPVPDCERRRAVLAEAPAGETHPIEHVLGEHLQPLGQSLLVEQPRLAEQRLLQLPAAHEVMHRVFFQRAVHRAPSARECTL